MDVEKELLKEIKKLEKNLSDLNSKYKSRLIEKASYEKSKRMIEEKIQDLKERLNYLKRARDKLSGKTEKKEQDYETIREFDLQKEMELLLKHYQIELEQSIITIFITISINRTEKIFLSIKDKYHPILKLNKNLLYLGDPFEYLETLKMWKQGKLVHIVDIIQEFERYLLDIIGMGSQSTFDLYQERKHILERARKFLKEKELGKATYLYDYAAELSSRLGEDKVAAAYRNKVHKLRAHMKGEFIL
ncbi:MAG: hypothetical protein ACTSWR_08075 [Candidatus Helarchaeota archaeon]